MAQKQAVPVREFFETLWSGRFDEARARLAVLPLEGPRAERIREHYGAQILIHQGQHREAAIRLAETLRARGAYVGLRIDLATCYQQLKSYTLMRNEIAEIEKVLLDPACPLQPQRRTRYAVWLAKHLEDVGAIGPSLELLSSVAAANAQTLDLAERVWIEIQELRLRSLFEGGERVAVLYGSLTALSEMEIPLNLRTEWRHGLMLAETHLFGPQHGLWRLEELLGRTEEPLQNRRFCLVDFIVATALKKRPTPLSERHLSPFPAAEAPAFERLVLREQAAGKLDMASFVTEAHQLSTSENLILLLLLSRSATEQVRAEIRLKFQTCLLNLDKTSRRLWMSLGREFFAPQEEDLRFLLRPDRISLNGIEIETGPAATLQKILLGLSREDRLATEALCERVWGYHDVSQLARLRMLVRRLNDELLQKFALEPIAQVTKETVRALRGFQVEGDVQLLKRLS